MPWLKFLHIVALVLWCASLLYLAAALVASTRSMPHDPAPGLPLRPIFTLAATPAALFAIASGTAVFVADFTLGVWLVAKLTAVAGLVLVHAWCGVLTIRREQGDDVHAIRRRASTAGIAGLCLILLILWLVLAKPL
ncbi:MAG TPA: CopD family protein [Burkholderiaceae bacterium]|nr:CopD family protein [Burkholderiaceae bacterium]